MPDAVTVPIGLHGEATHTECIRPPLLFVLKEDATKTVPVVES
jgi:hypothetical protein